MTDPLVSSQWLFENINNPDLIVLDASQKVDENNLQITGARYFDLKNNFSDKGSSLPNTFPNAAQFELESQKLGINHSSIIVVYDNEGVFSSPRVWWMYKTMGHQNVFVLNGGLPDWIKNNYPTEIIQPQEYKTGNFKTQLNPKMLKVMTLSNQTSTIKKILLLMHALQVVLMEQPQSQEKV